MRLIINKLKRTILVLSLMMGIGACTDVLEVTPDSAYAPDNFLSTEDGLTALLYSAYDYIQFNSFDGANKLYVAEWPTDISWETGGGLNNNATLYINYIWDPQHGWLNGFWTNCYQAIRDANTFLENVDNADITEEKKNMMRAEARFIRASAYFYLYNWFGPTPLVTTSEPENLQPERASDEEIKQFIETEFNEAAQNLPLERSEGEYGRATEGAALGMLTKFFLNTKQWQKCAQTANEIMELNIYELYPDYTDLFKVENEMNNEFIFVHAAMNTSGNGNVFPPAAFPPNYPTPGTHENWAAQVRLYDDFVNSFAEDDVRKDLIITEYTDTDGNEIQLLGDDNSRSFKYWPDPNANGRWTGNDIPEIRYADILLSRAEALNELNGVNEESINLLNMVRNRADLDGFEEEDFSGKEDFRDRILQERAWEFYYEGKRRQDMIRHGVLISNAQERGKNAQPHHVLYPIPQTEMDANPNLEQNDGYN